MALYCQNDTFWGVQKHNISHRLFLTFHTIKMQIFLYDHSRTTMYLNWEIYALLPNVSQWQFNNICPISKCFLTAFWKQLFINIRPSTDFQMSKTMKMCDIKHFRWYYKNYLILWRTCLLSKTHAILEAYVDMPLKRHAFEHEPKWHIQFTKMAHPVHQNGTSNAAKQDME